MIPPALFETSKVRAMLTCIVCTGPKPRGLTVCWPCHRRLKRDHDGGYGAEVEAKLALYEECGP